MELRIARNLRPNLEKIEGTDERSCKEKAADGVSLVFKGNHHSNSEAGQSPSPKDDHQVQKRGINHSGLDQTEKESQNAASAGNLRIC